jgi:pyrroloquinoline quinone biosynthesis protein B
MRVRVLGSAAGGGFPQWNCACDNCVLVRAGDARVTSRTQDCVAIESKSRWLLVNASPDVLRQIEATAALHPQTQNTVRDTPIAAVVLTNGDLDHVLGLFSLRESQPLVVYATDRVFSSLMEMNAIARTLQRFPGHMTHRRLVIGEPCVVPELGDLTLTAFASPGKLPIHLAGVFEPRAEDNVGLRITVNGTTVAYATAVRDVRTIASQLAPSDVLLLDGTFWSSDELVTQRAGSARAEDMAHHPIGGEDGSIAALASVQHLGRKILTHINNTNPILREDSPERAWASRMGWEIAHDGMEMIA